VGETGAGAGFPQAATRRHMEAEEAKKRILRVVIEFGWYSSEPRPDSS
jgi:hypothetical protein